MRNDLEQWVETAQYMYMMTNNDEMNVISYSTGLYASWYDTDFLKFRTTTKHYYKIPSMTEV